MSARKIIVRAGLGLFSLVMLATTGQTGMSATPNEAKAEGVVDARGNLLVPSNYRTTYEYLEPSNLAAVSGKIGATPPALYRRLIDPIT